jgi:RimJ/RimL family protein N-acetyltransferase
MEAPVTTGMQLRDVVESDYPIYFDLQRDEVASRMAAFGTKDADAQAFAARWKNGGLLQKAIVEQGNVIGYVASFLYEGKPQVTYWVARSHWGRGIATEALAQFLRVFTVRPVYASAAKDNAGSLSVLQKCGFAISGSAPAFANARGEDVEEVFLRLD